MQYRPKIIKGTVKGTGWPIDGHTLYFSQWDYDNRENWHLYGWDEPASMKSSKASPKNGKQRNGNRKGRFA